MKRPENCMKAIEFTITLDSPKITLPDGIIKELEPSMGKNARIILLIDEPDQYEEIKFRNLAEEQFFKGYTESDTVYDEL